MNRRRRLHPSTTVAALVGALVMTALPSAVATEGSDPEASPPQERAEDYRLEQGVLDQAPLDQRAAVAALAETAPWALSGSGWGHGVGMSQYGASQMAVDGYTAPQILGHYYTGTTYDLVPDTAVISVNLLNNASSATMTSRQLSTGGGADRKSTRL